MTNLFLRPGTRRLLVPLCAMILPPALSAATIDKANNNDALNLATSWSGGALPATTDTVRWSGTVTGASTVSTGANVTYAGIIVTNPGGLITINNNTITLGGSGIDMSTATQDLVINSNLTLSANQQWNLNQGRSITIVGTLTGTNGVATQTGGTISIEGATDNSNGRFVVGGSASSPGLLILNKASTGSIHAIGSSNTALTINANGTVQLSGSGDDQIFNNSEVNIGGGTLDMNGHNETIDGLIGVAAGNVSNSATGTTSILTVGGNNHAGTEANGTTTFSGSLKDGAGVLGFSKSGTGLQILNGTTSYTGQTTISGGVLRVDNASGLVSSNVLLSGGVLQVTAASTGAHANVTLGSGAGQVRWATNGGGGFATQGVNTTFTVDANAPLTWGQTDFVQGNQALIFGGSGSDRTATLPNALNLSSIAGTNGSIRTITVNEGGAAFEGELSGAVTGEGALLVNGSGGLRLSNTVAHRGGTFVLSGVLGYDSAAVAAGGQGTFVAPSGAVAYTGSAASIPAGFLNPLTPVGNSITIAAPGVNGASNTFATNVDFNTAPANLRDRLYFGATQQSGGDIKFTGTLASVNGNYRLGGGNGVLALTVANTLTGANNLIVRNGGVVRIDNVAQDFTGTISIDGGVFELRGNNANISKATGIVVNGVGNLNSQSAPGGYGSSATIFNRLRGGVLSLQSYKDPNGDLIGSQLVTLRGGAIAAHDSDGNSGTILVQNVKADHGYNIIAHQPQAAGTTHDELTITNLTRTAGSGATIEFRSQNGVLATATGDNGNINITNLNGAATANTNGILGGWAYASERSGGGNTDEVRNFATLAANGIDVASQNYSTAAAKPLSGATATDNVLVAGAGTNSNVQAHNVLTSNLTINSLITESPIDVKNGATLTIGTGGLIMRQAQNFLISSDNTGKLTSGLASGELFVLGADNQDVRITTLSIVDNGNQPVSLVKGGLTKVIIGGGSKNTYTGKTIVNAGNLQFDFRGGTGVLPSGDVIVRSGGIFATALNTNAPVSISNNVFLDGGTLRNENSGGSTSAAITYTGTISVASLPGSSAVIDAVDNNNKIILAPEATLTGTGDLTKIGSQTLEIQTSKTSGLTGTLTLAAGSIDLTGEGKLPVTDLVFTGGTLNLTTTEQEAKSLTGSSGTVTGVNTGSTDKLTLNQDIDTAFHGSITNTSIIKNGTGHLYLSGGSDNGAGSIVLNSGSVTLAKASSNSVHSAGGGTSLTINGGTARLGGTFTNAGGDATNTPPADAPANYVDQIYYQATVAINSGTLDLNGRSESVNGLTGSANGVITNSAASTTSVLYTGQNNGSSSFAGSIENGAGTVGYVKLGTGTQTLSGTNTYTGDTEVLAGTLSVTGSLSGSTVTVTGNVTPAGTIAGTLAGTGSVFGLSTEALGTIAPGINGPGTLTVLGNATFAGGTLSLQINGTTAGTQYDQLAASSVSLSSNVELSLTLGFTPTPFVDSFVIVSNTGANAIGGSGRFVVNNTPLAEGAVFTIGQDQFQITYKGGTGNDVVLQAVPEPNVAALLLLGAGLGLGRRRRQK